jgi:hypothetical protein
MAIITGFQVSCGGVISTATLDEAKVALGLAAAPPASKESPQGTIVPPAASIVDSRGDVWTIDGGRVASDGIPDAATQEVALLLYHGGKIYQKNIPGGWWLWSGTGWDSTADPRAPVVTPPPPGNSSIVTTLQQLQSALNNGALDITLTAAITAPAGGVNIPRINGGRIFRCAGNGLITRGASTGHVLRSDGSGGSLTLIGVRVDGGWRSNPHEGDDSQSNYYLEGFDFLRIESCVSAFSLRTGWNVGNCKKLEIVKSTLFACPRDTCWEPGVRDYLFEDNLVQHCGDDGWGTHFGSIGSNQVTKSIICRRNTFRDCFGVKGHGGTADGTHNGKKSQVLIEDNVFEACGLYGFYFWQDNGNNEPWSPPRNITFQRNKIIDLRSTTRSSGGQRIGVAMILGFPGASYDGTCSLRDNTFIRNDASSGQTLQSRYAWGTLAGKPSNVPGANSFQGFFTKTGFAPTETFELASTGYRNDGGGNAGAIQHSGNTWQGNWNNQLT